MLYTLYLSGHKDNLTFNFFVYKHMHDKTEHGVLVLNNGTYILNYQFDEVINTQQQNLPLELVKEIDIKKLKLEQY